MNSGDAPRAAATRSLNVAEVAHALRCSDETVMRRLRAGAIPGTKVCGAWRIPAGWDRPAGQAPPPEPGSTSAPSVGSGFRAKAAYHRALAADYDALADLLEGGDRGTGHYSQHAEP